MLAHEPQPDPIAPLPAELPPGITRYLFSGEAVIRKELLPMPAFSPALDPGECLMRLTGSHSQAEIGLSGPALASIAPPGSDDIAEFRLFEALFGRDSLMIASLVSGIHPELTRSTILRLAELQGLAFDPISEEEPGRIIHEHRADSDAIRERLEAAGWKMPYYGAIDSTPLFVRSVAQYCEAHGPALLSERITGRDGVARSIEESLRLAVAWIERRLDASPDGLLEYCRTNERGIANQCWKDSGDSFHHADGSIANHRDGVAAIEAQALAYDALQGAARIFDSSSADLAAGLREHAARLQAKVLGDLWIEDGRGGYFALGADRGPQRELRPLRVRASNMGHLLDSEILSGSDPEIARKRDALARTLMSPEMLSANGIRTLSSAELLFRPFAYHNGSVWPWDNAVIARGLRRHAYSAEAELIEDKILAVWKSSGLFPELVLGSDAGPPLNPWIVDLRDTAGIERRVAQPPQPIQGWTVAACLAAQSARGRAA